MPVTGHRQRILEVLQDWFRSHDYSPTLEELCVELGMSPERRATVQKWLQTMRGVDVDWEDNMARSIRLLQPDPTVQSEPNLSVAETLRYLATGLVEWEGLSDEINQVPEAFRLGLSRAYLTSLLQRDEEAPQNLSEFFDWANRPLAEWKPAKKELKYLADDVSLIEDGLLSEFTLQWHVEGSDTERQVQEKLLHDVLLYCRQFQKEEAYREFRKLIITQPVLRYREYRQVMTSSALRPIRDFVSSAYIDLPQLQSEDVYRFCPRCQYPQRRKSDNSYGCRSPECDRLRIEKNLNRVLIISAEEAEEYKVVTPGIHRYGTIPGIWEVELYNQLTQLGISVTLWPEIDEYDLLVDFGRRQRWAIDLKDWAYLDLERLKSVRYRSDTKATFAVFPDENNRHLRIKVVRDRLEPQLGGVRLRLISEIIDKAKAIVEGKNHA
ncbi:Fis family transcriptional regulator [Coleofasciculus sp. FACHB-T130]|uniref:restriction endonuclease-related protein n=1 Tax=Cyanophyceae TaxID=3028117 RepID=UPI0016872A58|nr:Fis family transcriptional regulator [Coleofasciculus sp. FACHB-T130]MBD1877847.1 Fis family transcriptional regulator [Coleofasciculus sp. FACHB-T130]